MHTPYNLFIHSATRSRHTITTSNALPVYGAGVDIPIVCRIQVLSGEESTRMGGDRNRRFAKIYTAPNQDIKFRDHIVDSSGRTWYVDTIREPDQMDAYMVIEAHEDIMGAEENAN